ncbi:ribonuclease H family protein [Tessaracoccus caeni]|uniref:ribonuclease H family protein n=1 Tax=Tessaracoccus caeni TaxID=3031239 RepID=UPI0023DA9D51|nr:ribonuclease H [Tessaracoccus caeni]MDF1488874.1 ribonuclease HI [Tessaracoccus caeni]
MIVAAADGSSLSNPGPAGWAWYVSDDAWAAGGWERGTNNMGELMAVLDLLHSTAHVDEPLHVLCDSQYVINSLTKWLPGWKRKGWKKGDGKPVLNVDLMKALDEALRGRKVTFEWVKGHSGHDMNEAADQRARAAATAYQQGKEPDRGPGYPGSTPLEGRAPASLETAQREAPRDDAPQPDLFSGSGGIVEDEPAPRPVPGSASPRNKAALVRASRSLFDAPSLAPRHPDFVCHADGAERDALPWPGPVSAELLSVDALGPESALVRAQTGDALAALVWIQLPGGWYLRFAALS